MSELNVASRATAAANQRLDVMIRAAAARRRRELTRSSCCQWVAAGRVKGRPSRSGRSWRARPAKRTTADHIKSRDIPTE